MFNSKALNTVPFIISLASGVAAMSLMAPSAQAQAVPSDTVDEIALLPRIAYEQFAGHRRTFAPGAYTNEDDTFSAWMAITSADAELDMPVQTGRAHTSQDGAILGGETRFMSDFVLGGVLSVGETTAEFTSGGRYALEGGSLSVYGAYDSEMLGRLSLTLTRGGHQLDNISRASTTLTDVANGTTDTSFWDVAFSARSTDEFDMFEIEHGITLAAGRVEADGFSEASATGTAFAFEDQAFNYRLVSLDATARGPEWTLTDAVTIRPVADIDWTYQFGDDDYGLQYRTVGATGPFTNVRANAPADHAVGLGFGAELTFNDTWMLTARYARQWADDVHDSDAATLTLRAVF